MVNGIGNAMDQARAAALSASGYDLEGNRINPNTFQGFAPNWWGQVLEQFEPAQYFSAAHPDMPAYEFAARSPRQRRFFDNSYQDILQDDYGTAGAYMRRGESPISFMDFLDRDPWTKRYSSLPQSARGVTGMASNPRTRFLFNY